MRLIKTAACAIPALLIHPICEAQVSDTADTLYLDVVDVLSVSSLSESNATSIIQAQTLHQSGHAHPAEVLNHVPGVNIQMNSGQEHLLAIRSPVLTGGAGQGSFLIQIDGIPTRAPAFGNVNSLIEIPFETAHKIEILRGPGGARHGSNAIHGVINVITPTPESANSYAAAEFGSLGRYSFKGAHSHTLGASNALISGSLLKDNGWRDQTGSEQQKLNAKFAHQANQWNWVTSLHASNLNQETAGFLEGENAYRDADNATTNANPEAFRDAWTARLSVSAARPLAGGELTFTPFALTQHMIFKQHFLPYGGIEKNGQDSAGLLSRYEFSTPEIDWLFGLDAQWASGYLKETQNEPFGFFPGDSRFPVGKHYDYDVTTLTGAGFIEANASLSPILDLSFGLRAETHQYDYTTNINAGDSGRFRVAQDRTDNFSLLTPKLGLNWTINEATQFYVNYSRGQRAPQASDLYRLQTLQGIAEAEVETNDSFEVGLKGKLAHLLRFDLAAYTMRKSDFFFRDANGLNVSNGKTDHEGIEVSIASLSDRGLFWAGQASYSRQTYAFENIVNNASETIVSGNDIDTAPKWLADFSIGYAWQTASIEWSIEHIGTYFTNAANTASYPGHTVHALNIEKTLTPELALSLNVHNLFDERYADRADFAFGNERYFPGEPLNATLGIRLQL